MRLTHYMMILLSVFGAAGLTIWFAASGGPDVRVAILVIFLIASYGIKRLN
ncbi:MAG: hypothetical protein ABJL67_10370 [Sulfitobacter sp.]